MFCVVSTVWNKLSVNCLRLKSRYAFGCVYSLFCSRMLSDPKYKTALVFVSKAPHLSKVNLHLKLWDISKYPNEMGHHGLLMHTNTDFSYIVLHEERHGQPVRWRLQPEGQTILDGGDFSIGPEDCLLGRLSLSKKHNHSYNLLISCHVLGITEVSLYTSSHSILKENY